MKDRGRLGRRGLIRATLMGVVITLLASVTATVTVTAEEPAPFCSGEPMFITEECTDPRFNDANVFIDIDEVRDAPIPHRFVWGGYRGTDARFSMYFPMSDQYRERFILGPVHQITPAITQDFTTPDQIQFAFDSGAYLVATNNGGNESCLSARDCLSGQYDPTIRGYRVNAAAAKFSREVAQRVYGYEHRPNGVIYGGSGGAYMTLSSAEQTEGVWDGTVPFVMGHPLAIPDHYTVRIQALRVLRLRDKFPCIVDAIEPGGSGDPYASCDFNEAEEQAFREATRLGFPVRGWFNHASMGISALPLIAAYVPIMDPTYDDDFWTQPGYLGTEESLSGDLVRAARIQHPTTVVATTPTLPEPQYENLGYAYSSYMLAHYVVGLPPKGIVLESLPEGNLDGADLIVESGPATGKSCPLFIVDRDRNLVACGGNSDPAVITGIERGEKVRVDNSQVLALETHHRHQVTDESDSVGDLYGWNQFRDEVTGEPLYPQRDVLVGPEGARQASGSVTTGKFHGKMIVVESVLDQDAFAWSADVYRNQVLDRVGEDNIDDNFRLWFTDNAIHSGSVDPLHEVNYTGVLQQAIRDLFTWIEDGISAPATTSYHIGGYWDDDEAQVQLAPTADERKGIQPVIDLTVNGGVRADIKAGDTVTLSATIDVPPDAGEVVSTEWNFLGSGEYEAAEPQSGDPVTVTATYTYTEPGTYFPVLRATSQREDAVGTQHAQILNLARARVVVT